MTEKYSLNAESLNFIIEFEESVPKGREYTNRQLVELFKNSPYHKSVFDTYIPTAINKSIWYAIKRSRNWKLTQKGVYQRQ